jgi:hypothetical protein
MGQVVCLSVCCVGLGVPLLFAPWPPLLCLGGSRVFGSLLLFLAPGFCAFFCGVSFMASSSFALLLAAAAAPVVPSAPVSLAPLSRVSWGGSVVLARLGWEASSSSVLVWVVGSSSPVVCRVGSVPPLAVSALVSELRALVRSGAACRLGVRGSWAGGRWFCAVSPV